MRKRHEIKVAETNPLEDDQEKEDTKDSIHSLHVIYGILFVFIIILLYVIVFYINTILPTPLTISDESENKEAFIAERAQNDLESLVSLGPRIVGTYENEILAVDLLKRKLAVIQTEAHKIQKIEIDLQSVTGSYYMAEPLTLISSYGDVQNIVVKLHSRNNSKNSLLINAHFDTVPTSPGGNDDGLNCAVMMEILRKLSSRPQRLEHNIVFLFNGAEESGLQASHGFITKHKWASEIGVVINLEAAGSGGKETLFQLGPSRPWLLRYYKEVPHPYAQVFAEEFFQAGFVPSDTDFRIFRDFGNLTGNDMAFGHNGYRYHTKFDGFANIPPGSYQHVGSNVLSLVQNLGNAPELNDPHGQPEKDVVFYDVFGLIFIYYSKMTAAIMYCVVSLISIIITLKSFYDFRLVSSLKSLKYVFLTFGALVIGWMTAAGFVLDIIYYLDAINSTMRWYNFTWLIFGLYAAPTIVNCCGILFIFNTFYSKSNLSISIQTQIQLHLVRLMWMILLLIGTIVGLRLVYIIFIPFLFQTLAFGIIHAFRLQFSIHKWQIVYTISMMIPTMFLMYLAVQAIDAVVPISGRSGIDQNPEIIIGGLTLLGTFLVTSTFIPLFTLLRKSHILLAFFGLIFIASFVFIFSPFSFPYTGNPNSPAPQRFYTFHTSRVLRNDSNQIYQKDAGVFIFPVDRNGLNTVETYLSEFPNKSLHEDCEKALLCGLPLANWIISDSLKDSVWIPSDQPITQVPLSLKLTSKEVLGSVTRFQFESSGPTHTAIYLSPRDGINVTNISLIPELPLPTKLWTSRLTYIIVHTWGKENKPLNFYVDFETPKKWNLPIFDIALSGKYMNNETNINSPHYIDILNHFPDFADVAPALGAYESWVY